jgi:bifunctional non-homologous end joining protein LigD
MSRARSNLSRSSCSGKLCLVRLKALLGRQDDGLQFVEHLEGDGAEIFEAACRLGLEGIVSKRADSAYKAGRSKMWLKIKNRNHPALIRVFDPHGRRSS